MYDAASLGRQYLPRIWHRYSLRDALEDACRSSISILQASRREENHDQLFLLPVPLVRFSRHTEQLLSVFNRYPGHSFQHASLVSFSESIPPVQSLHGR